MAKFWQLRHKEIGSGALALARCGRCKGTGVCRQIVAQFDGDGEVVEVERRLACDCRERALEMLGRAGLPPGRFGTAALGDLDWEAIQPAKAKISLQLYVERFEEMLGEGIGLTLTGNVGSGKTHVAVGLVRLACGMGVEAKFVSVPELLGQLRATYGSKHGSGEWRGSEGSESEILGELARAPLLALDDLGVVKTSDWVRDRLYTLINRRYVAGRPIVATMNEGLEALGRRLGQRITSRLGGASLEVCFEGEDYRRKARERVLKEMGMSWAELWERVD